MFRIKSFTGPISLALFAVAVFAPSFVLADTMNYVANLAPINNHGIDGVNPTLANADPDHDGLINLADGGVEYGPIQLNLVTSGAIVPGPGKCSAD